jgi:uracil-DNA glycosylase
MLGRQKALHAEIAACTNCASVLPVGPRPVVQFNRTARIFPLPHPSWRFVTSMARNPWFESKVLPTLRDAVQEVQEVQEALNDCIQEPSHLGAINV